MSMIIYLANTICVGFNFCRINGRSNCTTVTVVEDGSDAQYVIGAQIIFTLRPVDLKVFSVIIANGMIKSQKYSLLQAVMLQVGEI